MRGSVGAKLVGCFRQRDVHARLAALHPFEQKLQAECRLSRTGVPFDEMDAVGGQSAAKQVVEPGDARGRSRL